MNKMSMMQIKVSKNVKQYVKMLTDLFTTFNNKN